MHPISYEEQLIAFVEKATTEYPDARPLALYYRFVVFVDINGEEEIEFYERFFEIYTPTTFPLFIRDFYEKIKKKELEVFTHNKDLPDSITKPYERICKICERPFDSRLEALLRPLFRQMVTNFQLSPAQLILNEVERMETAYGDIPYKIESVFCKIFFQDQKGKFSVTLYADQS